MFSSIVNHIRNPYVSYSDSIIIMALAHLCSSFVLAFLGDASVISIIIITVVSFFLAFSHYCQFEKKKKNYIRGYTFAVILAEILIVINMMKYSMSSARISLVVSAVLITVYLIAFFAASHKCRFKKAKCIRGIHSILAICLTPCIISFVACWVGDKAILKQHRAVISQDINCSATPITVIEWDNMNFNQKFAYLNEIMKAEASLLGMSDTPEMEAIIYPEILLGTYNCSTDTISINAEHLRTGNVYDAISTLGHELYHRYEYIIVDDSTKNVINVEDERIAEYKSNFENPSSSVYEWEDYYNMSTEVDARTMGEQIADKYIV